MVWPLLSSSPGFLRGFDSPRKLCGISHDGFCTGIVGESRNERSDEINAGEPDRYDATVSDRFSAKCPSCDRDNVYGDSRDERNLGPDAGIP
jgi:hypothetical protein